MSTAYEGAGVDYETLDGAKRTALAAALSTSAIAGQRGAFVDDTSRGEPAVLMRVGDLQLGFVLECLGTKSMIARAYQDLTGTDRFDAIGYDTVAAVVNDCCCVGALPVLVNAYFATGSAAWYSGTRHASLVEGWRRACADSGAAWGGGESPTLSGLIDPNEIDLAGSAIGLVPNGVEPLAGERLAVGDEIVLIASSGLHANGASLVRQVAGELDGGLLARLPSGRLLAEAALDESLIYVSLLDGVFAAKLPVHYASHITGHGLRKVMRADREVTYRIETLPEVPEVLQFLASASGMDDGEAYGTLNMGVGFALYVEPGAGDAVVRIAQALGFGALVAGRVEAGARQVVLSPLDVTYGSDELELR